MKVKANKKGTYLVQTTTSWKSMQIMAKKLSKFTKKITHVDDMMIHNFVKYLVQTRLCLWDIIEICYFYISQTKSSLDKIFYKIVYHHIIYMCDFLGEFKRFFCRDLHGFSRKLWFSRKSLQCTLSVSNNKMFWKF